MKQHDIAQLFIRMADVLELKGDNPFRIRAYRRAAQNLESFSGDLQRLSDEGRLKELSGVGPELSEKITEYLTTGTIAAFERLRQSIPPGVFELLEVPGIGPKTAKQLSERLGIASIAQLQDAAKTHKLRGLPGFKEQKERNILKGIEIVKQGQERLHLGVALPLAEEFLTLLRTVPGVTRTSTAGSLRRMRETIGDLDLLAASKSP